MQTSKKLALSTSWSFRRDGNLWVPGPRCRNTPATSHGVESVEHALMHASGPEQMELNAVTCQYIDVQFIYEETIYYTGKIQPQLHFINQQTLVWTSVKYLPEYPGI